MIAISDKSDCCGCTACASICPHDAIKMEPDSFGFYYPEVDDTKCVDCGFCENVCQFNEKYDISKNLKNPIAYAARHVDIDTVMKSRSGAAFVAISDIVLENHGVVYGVGYKDHFRVCHKRAINKEQRNEFCGSKYVQSNLNGIFRQVRKDLNEDKVVLFSGTPCQTSGLRAFVGKRRGANLILIDIVCHGSPSPFIWKDYIDYIEKKYHTSIKIVDFRNKEKYGWNDHRETFISEKGDNIEGGLFTRLFYKHIIFRKSCGICYFTNLKRPSDITLADCWGWENTVPNMNKDNKGVSLVLINTNKGLNLFNTARQQLIVEEVDIKKCMQASLQNPVSIHPLRDEFEKEYSSHGFIYIINRYVKPSFLVKLINIIKYGKSSI